MAHDQHWRYLVTFTVPVDNHAYKHNVVVHSLDDEDYIRKTWRKLYSPDMKIISATRLSGDEEQDTALVKSLDEANRKEGGTEFRELRAGEVHLTQKQVHKIMAANAE